MSAAFAASIELIPCAEVGAWKWLQQGLSRVRRLWLPISLSVLLHLLALMWLHDMVMHGKAGQLEAGSADGLEVRLLDVRSSLSQMAPTHDNAATPISNAALPGPAPDVAQQSSEKTLPAETTQQRPVTPQAPAHPQKLADGAASLSASSSASADGVAVKPQAAKGGKGNFDSGYIPSTSVDRAPIPLTQPDMYRLSSIARPRAAITLRAYVEPTGAVHDVVVLSCAPEDQASADEIAQLFKDVVYIAAVDHGKQVASKIDFTISLSDASSPRDRPDSPLIRRSQP